MESIGREPSKSGYKKYIPVADFTHYVHMAFLSLGDLNAFNDT